MCAVLVAAFAAVEHVMSRTAQRGPSAMGGTLDLLAAPAHDLERPLRRVMLGIDAAVAGATDGTVSAAVAGDLRDDMVRPRATCDAILRIAGIDAGSDRPAELVSPHALVPERGETSEVVAEEAGPSLTYEPAPPDLEVLGCSRGRWSTGCGSR